MAASGDAMVVVLQKIMFCVVLMYGILCNTPASVGEVRRIRHNIDIL